MTRDAARSKEALLDAAAVLFAERGYVGTSLRAVAEKAGVDAALVARYFDNKEGLFRAVIEADILEPAEAPETPSVPGPAFGTPEHLHFVLERWSREEVSAVTRSLFRTDTEAASLLAIRGRYEATVQPRARSVAAKDHNELRADLAAVLLMGVGIVRSAGTFPTLAAASIEEVEEVLAPMLNAILRGKL